MKRPLHIGLIDRGGRGWIGGSMYTKNLIFALASLPQPIQSSFSVSLLGSGDVDGHIQEELGHYLKHVYPLDQLVPPVNLKNRLIWKGKQILLRQSNPALQPVVKLGNIDFLYPTTNPTIPPLNHQSCPWIPDFQHKHLPHLFSRVDIRQRDQEYGRIAQYSKRVVLSSKMAVADFNEFFPASKTETFVLRFRSFASPAWYQENSADIQAKYHLPDRFFIVCSQFWQHKNHSLILDALQILKADGICPNIVCTGHVHDHRHPEYSDSIFSAIHTYGLSQQIFILGLLPRADQIQLIRRSLAILHPSLFEGWSTVVEDGRALGKSMVLSDFPVHLEQQPPKTTFFGRYDAADLASVLANQWQVLQPGPDRTSENEARFRNQQDMQALGYRFLALAQNQCSPEPDDS